MDQIDPLNEPSATSEPASEPVPDAAEARFITAVRAALQDGVPATPAAMTTAAVDALRDSIARTPTSVGSSPLRRSTRYVRWTSVIAGCAILVAIAISAIMQRGTVDLNDVTRVAQHTYTTRPGDHLRISLPNGATMTLAPASTARVTADLITIDGAAYFTIPHHASRVFSVQTPTASLHILGTAFSIREYPGDPASQIVVEEGKVSVQVRRAMDKYPRRAVLSAAMLASVTDSGITVTSGIPTQEYLGWVDGQLTFREARLSRVVAELSRAYGVDIRLADSTLATRGVTMTASVETDSVADVLELMTQAVNARVQRVGSSFVIVSGRPTTRSVPRAKDALFNSPSEIQYGR